MPENFKNKTAILSNELYDSFLKDRGLTQARIRRTATLDQIRGIPLSVRATHVWIQTDSLHKLSVEYYGDPQYWWVIGMVNEKPTDSHFTIGDEVLIPDNPIFVKEVMK